jgi:nicotinamidase-related amidase
MLPKNHDLHGNVPDKSSAALLLIDVINDLEFEGGEQLARHILPLAGNIADLKRRAKQAGVPVVYVNDNFGKWQSDFAKLVTHCLESDVRGRPLAKLLQPEEDDYFVLKPKHSGFFASTLETLLQYLQAHTLIIAGVAGNICVLFTAQDAYMRDFRLYVPADCIASNTPEENEYALRHMRSVLEADTRKAAEIDFDRLSQAQDRGRAGKG